MPRFVIPVPGVDVRLKYRVTARHTTRLIMPQEQTAPTLRIGRYQTIDGQPVVLLYHLREHWYGHFADQDSKRSIEKWHPDGAHVENPGWNLKIMDSTTEKS